MFQIGKTHPHCTESRCTDVLQYVCTDLSTGAMIPIMLPGIELKIQAWIVLQQQLQQQQQQSRTVLGTINS